LPNGVVLEILEPGETARQLYQAPIVSITVDDLAQARRELEGRQVEVLTPIFDTKQGHGWTYFRAPDGNVYQIQGPYQETLVKQEEARPTRLTTESDHQLALTRLDHLVLTVADVDASCAFYEAVLGMRVVTFGAGRKALAFGSQKINLHTAGREFEPKADRPTPGSADLCFLTELPLAEVIARLLSHGVRLIEGPVIRTGAVGPLRSVYFRDPDGNLIEVANALPHDPGS
jgi:catechol 2,3-dioxygenase-like lactoylglutathione lyase family enzyme